MKVRFFSFIALLAFTTSLLATVPPDWFENHGNGNTRAIASGCSAPSGQTFLELNNVKALIYTGGDMWWNLATGKASYEIPKESGKHSLFVGGVWVGGTDVNNQLRVCAVRYRANGVDYYTGPLITSGAQQASVTEDVCLQYDKHFDIYRKDVARYRSYINAVLSNDQSLLQSDFSDYVVPDIITNWPAHGDAAAGYDYYLAPFFDANDNEYYDPENGDYPFFDLDGNLPCGTTPDKRVPRLYGDETLWWVYNDKGNVHNESGGNAIGMEIRAQAFAFSTNDELNNMTFYHYELINRSTYTLKNCYFAINNDADIGNAWDDYTGCDVQRGLGYMYNGDGDDDGADGYGSHPPAAGMDFFEGPYQDPDGIDNLSNWDNDHNLDCGNGYQYNPATEQWEIAGSSDLLNGNINGLNFGDGTADNERWGMRRFIYYINGGGQMGDPETATEYYNYMRGYWRDGTRLTYGGDGHSGTIEADFMFPGNPTTDPCGWGTAGIPQADWSEVTEGNTPDDRRFVQSAGPFTLKPGAINDLTFGAVWARSQGTPWESVIAVQRADDKAQRLFENCFKVVDGPDAPELKIIEMDKQLVFYIYNKKGSNNYNEVPEDYCEKDPFINCPVGMANCDRYYRFEGYQVFQLKDENCSVNDIRDPSKAKLVFQTDVQNGVGQLVNYEYDQDLQANVPTEMVNGSDEGIKHSFTLTQDMFATGDNRLVNHKTYYYVAIAYAYNNYYGYNPISPDSLPQVTQGQKTPYLSGRKGADGQIKTYNAIPHILDITNDGTILNSTYGNEPAITQYEGHGNGSNVLEISEGSEKAIFSLPSEGRLNSITYQPGYGPIKVKVIDPLHVVPADFVLKFSPDYTSLASAEGVYNGYIYDQNNPDKAAKWYLLVTPEGSTTTDTVWSENWINLKENEYLLPDYGISITIAQTVFPTRDENPDHNGYLTSSMTFSDITKPWLTFLADGEGNDAQNWIRSGHHQDPKMPVYDDIGGWDDNESYEQILDGTWAPYRLVAYDDKRTLTADNGGGIMMNKYGIAKAGSRISDEFSVLKFKRLHRIPSVDIVITSDRSKWTRCPVIETCEFDTSGGVWNPGPSEGGAPKFHLRRHPSIDKYGRTSNIGNINDENASNFVADSGMGWFPGYVIDVETGERLNIMYGEDSRFPGENGRDMVWNPTSNYYTDLYYMTGGASGDVLFGGKHYLYILGHSYLKDSGQDTKKRMVAYDYGKMAYTRLHNADIYDKDDSIQYVFSNATWVSIPMMNGQFAQFAGNMTATDPYGFIATDVRIKLRMANPYKRDINTFAKDSTQNDNYPMYGFTTIGFEPTVNDLATAQDALDLINVVPNPYYGYSEYEKNQVENIVKFTNLPQRCTISIYMVNGTLIRRFKKDNALTYQDWDLKNEYGIGIASGLYIIHVDAPGIGEKILKWFGSLRPTDLSNF